MSPAQMSPPLFSKVEASGLEESSGGEMCMVGLQVFSGHSLSSGWLNTSLPPRHTHWNTLV